MSATIHTLPQRERTYRPDIAMTFGFIDRTEGDEGLLFELAQMGLNAVTAHRRRGDDSPQACQGVVNGLGLAFFALATLFGIPRGEIEDSLSGDGGAA